MSNGNADPKIIETLSKKEDGSKPFVSIEFFPPRSDVGVKVRTGFVYANFDPKVSLLVGSLFSLYRTKIYLPWTTFSGNVIFGDRTCTLAWTE